MSKKENTKIEVVDEIENQEENEVKKNGVVTKAKEFGAKHGKTFKKIGKGLLVGTGLVGTGLALAYALGKGSKDKDSDGYDFEGAKINFDGSKIEAEEN